MMAVEIIVTKRPQVKQVLKASMDMCANALAFLQSQLAIVETEPV